MKHHTFYNKNSLYVLFHFLVCYVHICTLTLFGHLFLSGEGSVRVVGGGLFGVISLGGWGLSNRVGIAFQIREFLFSLFINWLSSKCFSHSLNAE